MTRRARPACAAFVIAAMLTLPAAAIAATYQYFSGTLYDGSRVNSSDGYKYRSSNNVKRPFGAKYDLTYFWEDTGYQRDWDDTTTTFTLYPTRYSVRSIVQCGNISGTNNVNVSCWAIQ